MKPVKERIREVLDKDANYVNDKTLDCLVNNITKIIKDMECNKEKDLPPDNEIHSQDCDYGFGYNAHISQFWAEWEGKEER